MPSNFPDTTLFRNGVPSELSADPIRRGPSLTMLFILLVMALLCLLLAISEALAAELPPTRMDVQQLLTPARRYLIAENAALGDVQVDLTSPDARLDLAACAETEAFLPPGARAQGHTTVGVRCVRPVQWTVYMQANVHIRGHYLVAARPLAPGEVLALSDVVSKEGELTGVPAGNLGDADAIIGRQLLTAVSTGQALRREWLKVQTVVSSGQSVHLRVLGRGFEVSGEGTVIAGAGEGQPVQVRTARGNVLSGVAHAGGTVDIRL